MSSPVILTFLPWMRRGLTRSIAEQASAGLPQSAPPTVTASFRVGSATIERSIRLQGPGDVAGLASGQVLRQEPPAGSQNSEPNYFPAVELSDPALPWTFTPASAPADQPLQPWLTLAVVREQPGVRLETSGETSILFIEDPASPSEELPDLAEAWNWAHVEASTDLSVGLAEAYRTKPSAFRARLLSPRRLQPETPYLAVVVPTFRQGVQAGFGIPSDPADLTPAWSGSEVRIELPVYHSWRFRTGARGDFESLVRRLQPVELGPDAGMRDLSLRNPGVGLPPAKRPLSYEGAILSPIAQPKPWAKKHREEFQTELSRKLGAASRGDDDAEPYNALDHDPVVAPPAYGLRQAGLEDVPAANGQPRWLAEVNLDPRHRSQAGLGARMVRRNQEKLMADAWEQAKGLRSINAALARWTLAAEVGERARMRLTGLDPSATLQLTAPAHARLNSARLGKTLLGGIRDTSMPVGSVSPAFRRQLRKQGPVGRALPAAERESDFTAKVTREFEASPVKMLASQALRRPAGVSTDDGSLARRIVEGTGGRPEVPSEEGRRIPSDRLEKVRNTDVQIAGLRKALRDVPTASKPFALAPKLPDPSLPQTTPSSVVARSPLLSKPSGVQLQVADAALSAIQPRQTLAAQARVRIQAPKEAWNGHSLPARMLFAPVFPDPAYKTLLEMGLEYLMPGAESLADDSVSAAATNASFVEAFLVGANHELASEFLWREYPTPLNGTWMRCFWNSGGGEDIGEISAWRKGALGAHQTGPGAQESIILLIKGDLLRRYPNTLIELAPAKWQDRKRVLDPTKAALTPSFFGRLGDGLSFFGFELSVDEARGSVKPGDKKPGWFFVFTEPPGDTRFGLDVGKRQNAGKVPGFWKNLSWFHMVDQANDLQTLSHAKARGRLEGVSRKFDTGRPSDVWARNSAATARITLQRPVRVLLHADTLLADPVEGDKS